MISKNDNSPRRKSQKVAKFSLGADEVVVAKTSKRAPLKIGASEGLHLTSLFNILQLNLR
ncbi:MAG: hypothetical protein HYR91_14945 [Flavobacteriia bacterium]|nr:hypothetical protein [Flavobacteriia bacterium]